MDATAEILGLLHQIKRSLASMKREEPHLTKAEFARRAGISTTTVFRRIADGTIATKNGRIPQTELSKFLS